MAKFDHDIIVPDKNSTLSKKEQVAEMFDSISNKYDFLNHVLSFGIDKGWRKKALKILGKKNPQTLLDVATGTGDFAILASKILNTKKIIGVDISNGMLDIGKEKIAKLNLNEKIQLQYGDSEDLPFDENSFDAATVAFGVRNFQNLEQGLSEIKKVLNPGGQLVVLEFSRPKSFIFKSIYDIYMKLIAPKVGEIVAKNKSAYQYLDQSIKKFPEGQNFTQIMKSVGFQNVTSKTLTFGICSIYFGEKGV